MASKVLNTLLFLSFHVVSTLSQGQAPYYGKLLHSGWGEGSIHDLAGDIYAVDENTIQIRGFTYDGIAPDAFFYLGADKSYGEVKGAGNSDSTATIIPYPKGSSEKLGAFDNEDIVLELPAGKVITDYTYISVWCRQFTVYFGGFDIPNGFVAPGPQSIGSLATRGHGVSSGDITIINDKTISIKGLNYDGQGPDAYFYVGISGSVTKQSAPYGKIPDENGDPGVISAYAGKDVMLTLPGDLSFTKLKWICLYCIRFSENFGEVFIPENLNVPPAIESAAVDTKSMNCEPLSNKLQISWLVEGDTILFEMAGVIDRNTDYMAFGLSGSEDRISMFGADVVVADWKEGGVARAVDYYLTGYAQCSTNGGACPDTSTSNVGGAEDVTDVTSEDTDGITRIRYKRKLVTGDSKDKEYKINGAGQQIVWAIGPLNTNDEAAKHYPGFGRTTIPKTIEFGRNVVNNCPELIKEEKVTKPDFSPHHLYGKEGSTVFTAEIGQAGSDQGYKALTGKPSWGIAWYVNGILIPELHLKRGVSYTFRVGGGTDPSQGAKYHPFYFTDDVEGGFQQKTDSTETIYGGSINGEPADIATGGYCEWKLTSDAIKAAADGKVYQCFEEFKDGLSLSCDDGGEYTEFTWTPDSNTPDLLYYQCYTHKSLGWKVHIYDELPTDEVITPSCVSPKPNGSTRTSSDATEGTSNTNSPPSSGVTESTASSTSSTSTATAATAVVSTDDQVPYYGKLLHSGWGEGSIHDLAGDIYAVDENTIRIKGFTYDGVAPDAFFYLGADKSYEEVKGAGNSDSTATIIPYPKGSSEKLGAFDNEDIVLELPAGKVITDYTYISVWCRQFTVYFGGFDIPNGFVAPGPQSIGSLATRGHGVSSGDITIINDKTISIKGLNYDGQGPDAYFYVGISDSVTKQSAPYGKIPGENGDPGVISAYAGKDVMLTLPGDLSFTKLKWLCIYCIQFSENFGEVFIPEDLNVPPALESVAAAVDTKSMNCEPLSNKLQISWLVEGDTILFEMAGVIDRNTDYMAFGLSGSDDRISMFGADVVVADWRDGGVARAVDYYLTGYAQCSTNGGACPDTSTSNVGGADDVADVTGDDDDGVTRIRYKRKLVTGDSKDKEYKIDGAGQQIVWAIGPLNTNDEAAKHYPGFGRTTIPKAIEFGRSVVNNCPELIKEEKVTKPDFSPHHLYGKEGSTVFTAEIGQAGSDQGYKALTGKPSWGIAWYVNGILIPELHLKRGVSYTFRVGGGTDPSQGAKYHPFYFTDDVEGGFQQKTDSTETIYGGRVNGEPADFATGGYCEWELTNDAIKAAADGKVYQCFEEFKDDLSLSCDDGSEYTEFTWTPDSNTPDLLYYQCYTHKSLGWKVHIYDELPTDEVITPSCVSPKPTDTSNTNLPPSSGVTESTSSTSTATATSPTGADVPSGDAAAAVPTSIATLSAAKQQRLISLLSLLMYI